MRGGDSFFYEKTVPPTPPLQKSLNGVGSRFSHDQKSDSHVLLYFATVDQLAANLVNAVVSMSPLLPGERQSEGSFFNTA